MKNSLLINKYEKINKNKKEYFKNAKIVNFNIIKNKCNGQPLQNSVKYYQTIHKDDLKYAKEEDKEEFISAAIRSKREDLYIEKDIINQHFRLTPELIKFKQKNRVLFSSMHRRKKREKNINNDII